MRKRLPKEGDRRLIIKFLLFPAWTKEEWRWWERVIIEQEYNWNFGNSKGYNVWTNLRFIDKMTSEEVKKWYIDEDKRRRERDWPSKKNILTSCTCGGIKAE